MTTTFHVGNMFTADPTIKAFAHGCNGIGVMGAGVAKQIKERFPWAYEAYRDAYPTLELGACQVVQNNDITVFNLITQPRPGPTAKKEYIYLALARMVLEARVRGIGKIALPLVGAGLGGLNPQDIKMVLLGAGEIYTPLELCVYELG